MPGNAFPFTIIVVEFDRDQLIALVRGTQFESEVLEQLPLMNGDHYLPSVLFGKNAHQPCELGNMHFIHRLHWVIEDQAGHNGIDGQVESKKE